MCEKRINIENVMIRLWKSASKQKFIGFSSIEANRKVCSSNSSSIIVVIDAVAADAAVFTVVATTVVH